MLKKHKLVLPALLSLCLLIPALTWAAVTNVTINNNKAVDLFGADPAAGQGAYIDWNQKVIIAKGIGSPAEGTTAPEMRTAQALSAAKVAAQRNLLAAVQSPHIIPPTITQNSQVLKEQITASVQDTVRGARETERRQLSSNTWEVTLAIAMYPDLSRPVLGRVFEKIPGETVPGITEHNTTNTLGYTGLIVQIAGLPLHRTFTPIVYDETDRAVYGPMNSNREYALAYGLVDYAAVAQDISAISLGQSRAGSRPFIVKAKGLRDDNYNVVISRSEADALLEANRQSGNFLFNCAVVFQQ